jgi:hypothetical protein
MIIFLFSSMSAGAALPAMRSGRSGIKSHAKGLQPAVAIALPMAIKAGEDLRSTKYDTANFGISCMVLPFLLTMKLISNAQLSNAGNTALMPKHIDF